jgi:hypothetical protein
MHPRKHITHNVSSYGISMWRSLCCLLFFSRFEFQLSFKKIKNSKKSEKRFRLKFRIPDCFRKDGRPKTVFFSKKTHSKKILHCILYFTGNQKLVFVDTRKINAHIQVHNKPIWKDLWIFAAFEFRARSSYRDSCTSLDQPRKLYS